MLAVPDKLSALAALAIQKATAAYAAGGTLKSWRRDMERAITTATTAAYLAATAARLGMSIDSPLFAANRLTRAERADIAAHIAGQIKYLDKFMADIAAGRLSAAQIAARALMYAGSVRPFYYASRWGDWEIPSNLLPGQQACLGNCRCTISDVRDNGDGTGVLTRVMGGENHCGECPPLAGEHTVRRRRAA